MVYEARACEEWWQWRGGMKSYGKEAGGGGGVVKSCGKEGEGL